MYSNIQEEIRYYVEQNNSIGAIMLTGSWGSGKTWFVRNKLTDMLKDTHNNIIMVSLFGINSSEQFHKAIKTVYLIRDNKVIEKAGKVAKNAKSFVKSIPFVGNALSALASVDVFDFVELPSDSIIIFDDFERCTIPIIDLIGLINEYTENKKIKTIVVANEEEIKSCDYNKYKEKLITKTIKLVPNVQEIVSFVIEEYETEYSAFLRKHMAIIENDFYTCCDNNIRTLKCCLQGFKRIWDTINEVIPCDKRYDYQDFDEFESEIFNRYFVCLKRVMEFPSLEEVKVEKSNKKNKNDFINKTLRDKNGNIKELNIITLEMLEKTLSLYYFVVVIGNPI